MRHAVLMLETAAAQARCTMACAFGSSAEFEAAVIRARLASEGYRRKRRQCYIAGAIMAMFAVAALFSPF
jgi:hypothetical protein